MEGHFVDDNGGDGVVVMMIITLSFVVVNCARPSERILGEGPVQSNRPRHRGPAGIHATHASKSN